MLWSILYARFGLLAGWMGWNWLGWAGAGGGAVLQLPYPFHEGGRNY